jgi:hypothetical protein
MSVMKRIRDKWTHLTSFFKQWLPFSILFLWDSKPSSTKIGKPSDYRQRGWEGPKVEGTTKKYKDTQVKTHLCNTKGKDKARIKFFQFPLSLTFLWHWTFHWYLFVLSTMAGTRIYEPSYKLYIMVPMSKAVIIL